MISGKIKIIQKLMSSILKKSFLLIILSSIALSAYTQQPVINSFTPASGSVGSTVTINGSNFSTTAANNVVYFGAVKATVTIATSTSLNVMVPKGASFQPITVTTQPLGLTAYSTKPFLVTFPGGDNFFNTNSFVTAFTFTFSSGVNTNDFLVGDIDADGRPDIAALSWPGGSAHELRLFRNTTVNGQVTFAAPIVQTYFGTPAQSICFADIDGDGLPDLLTSSNLSVFRNLSTPGNINLATPIIVTNLLPGQVSSIQVNDLDKDGKPDIVFTNGGAVTVLKNNSTPGNISLANQIIIHPAAISSLGDEELRIADLDGDSKPDLAVTYFVVDSIYTFRNLSTPGNILFETPVKYSPGQYSDPEHPCIGDIDNDGKPDLLFPNSDKITIYKNNSTAGSITFTPYSGFSNLFFTNRVEVADLNGDEKLDIVTNHSYAGAAVFKNNSIPCNVSFDPNVDYGGPDVSDLAICDLTGDGKSEIIIRRNSGLIILKNNVGQTAVVCSGNNTTIPSSLTGSAYQWQQNSGSGYLNISNGPNFSGTNTPLLQINNIPLAWNGYKFRCLVDADTSNVYSLSVNTSLLPVIKIANCQTVLCTGTSTSFIASTTNAGSTPAFQWQDSTSAVGWVNISGATSATLPGYTPVITGTKVRCNMTSSYTCASPAAVSSNALTLQINAAITPSVSISGNTTVISGQSSLLTATVTNGGTTPAYQWQDSIASHTWQNINGAIASTLNYTPVQTGDKARCLLSSNANCATPATATSNALIFTVNTATAINPVPGSNYGIRYYPSPVKTVLFIDSLKLTDKWQTLEIKSMDGRSVLPLINIVNRISTTVNVERLPAGQYVAVLRRKNGIPAYLKFVKQ
jgi:hypothetical protein